MPDAPPPTRTRIMDVAQRLVLERGFGNTSVDAVIREAGVTKGAFFHHFSTKRALGHALVERYAREEGEFMDTLLARADRLSRDPLQRILLFLGLFQEAMDHLEEPYPGCLFATLIYESPLLDPETMALARDTFADWRASFGARLREVDGLYPLPSHLFPEDLADMFQSVVEGGLIMARIMEDPRLLARQVGHYRSFLELAFGGASSPRGSRAPKPT